MNIIRKASVVAVVLCIICMVLLMLGVKQEEIEVVSENSSLEQVYSCAVELSTMMGDALTKHESSLVAEGSTTSFYNDMQYSEYPVACQVWQRLREYGFNEYVSAGILGNMMAECGGQTLNLQYNIYGGRGNYYGLCQWSLKYTPQVNGLDVDGQMDVLFSNIQTNMTYFKGNYEYFCSIQNEKEAAIYFQKYYERGAGSNARSNNAVKALNYFKTTSEA